MSGALQSRDSLVDDIEMRLARSSVDEQATFD